MLKEKEKEIKLRVYNVCTLSKYDERDTILYNVRGPNDVVQVFDINAIESKIEEVLRNLENEKNEDI